MAGRRRSSSRPDEERSGSQGTYGGEEPPDDGGYGGEQPQGPGNPEADPVRIHREYVERRLGGGERLPPAEFRRVEAQWQALPGSIRRPPLELKPDEEPSGEQTDAEAGDESSDGPA